MLTLPAVLLLTASGLATAQDKPARWEYAELAYRNVPARPAGVGADGKQVEGTPATTAIRWTTGADEATYKAWGELAEKLKVMLRKDATATAHRLQVLTALGADGWELVSFQPGVSGATRPAPDGRGFTGMASGPTGTTLLFKRRVP